MSNRPKCLHCQRRLASRPRQLCAICYYRPEVRVKYPRKCVRSQADEPSMEELDALIEERSKVLPKWWWLDVKRLSPFRGGFQPRFTAPVRATGGEDE